MSSIGVDEWSSRVREEQSSASRPHALRRHASRIGWWPRLGVFGVVMLLLPHIGLSVYQEQVGINALLLALTAVGLNIAVGWAGLFDLGYVAFYGFGAYVFALLASNQLGQHGIHLDAFLAIPIAVVVTALIGVVLGQTTRRVSGDYLAILTLFFAEAFNEVTNNVDSNRLGGPNGISGVDPIHAFGSSITTPLGYYYLLAVVLVLVMAGLHLLDKGRIGHAWQSVREDALVARLMTIPINRVKLIAYALGAGVAALAGSIFAASQGGVYPISFTQPTLVLIYAALVVGGTGTLSGAAAGALALTVVTELLRQPNYAGDVFYGAILLGLVLTIRPRIRLAAMLGTLMVAGFAARAIVEASDPEWAAGPLQSGGVVRTLLGHWLIVPSSPTIPGNWAVVVLVALGMAATTTRGVVRDICIVGAVYAAAFAWEARLAAEPSITRQMLIGALLVSVMIVRPQGFFGFRRTAVV